MHPRFRFPLMALAAVASVAALLVWQAQTEPPPTAPSAVQSSAPMVAQVRPEAPRSDRLPAPPADHASAPITAVPRQSAPVMAGAEPAEMVMFQIDAQGRIVTDEAARLAIEKLFALNEAAERNRKLRLLQDSLPPAAARELGELMARFDAYQEAQYQTLPPGVELRSVPEALAQLARLQQLREQYFGHSVAAGFFGEEEKAQRNLLLTMAVDTTPGLSLEEKAARALRPGG